MKTIVNRSKVPVRISLPGNRTLFLGPAKSGQISDEAAARPSVAKLIASGAIEVVGEGEGRGGTARDEGHVHEGTHGHVPRKVVLPKGDR